MLCQNCGKNEANVKYTQIINGVKKEMSLCENCAKELGIEEINFNMPINFSSFLGDLLEAETSTDFIPNILMPETLECKKCKMTYEEFLKIGKFGCENCYETFKDKIDPLLKNIHGGNRHIGRNSEFLGKNVATEIPKHTSKIEEKEKSKLEELKERLKLEIKEERYEEAAKTRDEIKKIEKK